MSGGKSFSATGSGAHASSTTTGKQMKGIEKNVTVNANKAAQLRTQLSKGKK